MAMIDPKLPALRVAADGSAMRERLAAALSAGAVVTDLTPTRVACRVLKHTIGKRCVIAYDLYDGAREIRVVAKLYRGDRGKAVFERLTDLWRRTRGGDSLPSLGMPEPIAYLAELGMVLQSEAPGTPLDRLERSGPWVQAVHATADNLARLHAVTGALAETRPLAATLRRLCRPAPPELAAACPEFAPAIARVSARLASAVTGPEALVHGDLGLGQVFFAGERATFVDFEGPWLASPSLGVANFMVSLEGRFGSAGEPLKRAFVGRYAVRGRAGALEGLGAYLGLAYLRRATTAFRAAFRAGAGAGNLERVSDLVRRADRASGSSAATDQAGQEVR